MARQTAREVYSRHYIGEAARRRRLAEIAARLSELREQIVRTAADIILFDRAVRLLDRGAR